MDKDPTQEINSFEVRFALRDCRAARLQRIWRHCYIVPILLTLHGPWPPRPVAANPEPNGSASPLS
jgi:hypothetical protein